MHTCFLFNKIFMSQDIQINEVCMHVHVCSVSHRIFKNYY